MNLVFMGTPDFAVPSLEILIENGYKPVAVVTRPDLPRGRGQQIGMTPIKTVALKHEIPVLQPESLRDPAFISALQALEPDVMVVVAFRILPPEVYQLAKKGAFNLHGSLLPAFRGAAPIHHAVMQGVKETGITTFFLREKVDTGDMILQTRTPIGENETTGEVYARLMQIGADAVLETVHRIAQGNVQTFKQDEALASPAPKLFKEHCEIDWAKPAEVVHNQIRGLSPIPCAFTFLDGKQLKIYRSALVAGEGEAGMVLEASKRLVVACGTGAVSLEQLQLEGRKRLAADVFLAGQKLNVGTFLTQDA